MCKGKIHCKLHFGSVLWTVSFLFKWNPPGWFSFSIWHCNNDTATSCNILRQGFCDPDYFNQIFEILSVIAASMDGSTYESAWNDGNAIAFSVPRPMNSDTYKVCCNLDGFQSPNDSTTVPFDRHRQFISTFLCKRAGLFLPDQTLLPDSARIAPLPCSPGYEIYIFGTVPKLLRNR